MQQLLDERKIWFGGKRLPTSLKPHLIPPQQYVECERVIAPFCGFLERLGKLLLENQDLIDQLKLPPPARELFEIDPGYERLAVICRPDMTWGPHGLSLYEVNTDSPAMLVFSDVVDEIQRELFPFAEIAERHQLEHGQRTKKLLGAIIETFQEWGGTEQNPTIAIVDWADQKTQHEQEYTAELFTRMGFPSFTCTPHELRLEGNRLTARGRKIDIVQRRVLFPDFILRRDELEPLLHAYREHLVCMVNPLRSFVLGNKGLLALLSTTLDANLRDELGSVLPPTRLLDDAQRARIASNKERYVVKGCLGYGGAEVVIGAEVNDLRWRDCLAKSKTCLHVVQEYRSPFTYRLPRPNEARGWAFDEYYGNWNPVLVGGSFAGGITRVSKNVLVSITAEGALLPSLRG